MKICKILASGHFLLTKYSMPPKVLHPPAAKIFLHFCPILSSHIFGLKLLRLLKLKTWNFYRQFPTNFRYGFDFLIGLLCLNFELQTFKTARFFKNILFYTFLRGYLTLQILYCYSLIKLAMLLKYGSLYM